MRNNFIKLLFIFLITNISNAKVKLGADVFFEKEYKLYVEKKISLFCNNASRTNDNSETVLKFKQKFGKNLICLLTPEHGYSTKVLAGKDVKDETNYGIKTFSLYGKYRKPSKEMLEKSDVIFIDIQDIGIRSYTYISSIFKIMEAASEYGKQVVILDRPNPLGGDLVDGNILENEYNSFVGIAAIPYLHGMTIGELAEFFNKEKLLKDDNGRTLFCKLKVIKMQGWKRNYTWEDCGLKWITTSPNINSVNAIRGAAAFGIIGELSLAYLGIGTHEPFQRFSINHKNWNKLKNELAHNNPSKLGFKTVKGNEYLELDTKYKDIKYYSEGIFILSKAIHSLPGLIDNKIKDTDKYKMFIKVVGSKKMAEFLLDGNYKQYESITKIGLKDFEKKRKKYLLY